MLVCMIKSHAVLSQSGRSAVRLARSDESERSEGTCYLTDVLLRVYGGA